MSFSHFKQSRSRSSAGQSFAGEESVSPREQEELEQAVHQTFEQGFSEEEGPWRTAVGKAAKKTGIPIQEGLTRKLSPIYEEIAPQYGYGRAGRRHRYRPIGHYVSPRVGRRGYEEEEVGRVRQYASPFRYRGGEEQTLRRVVDQTLQGPPPHKKGGYYSQAMGRAIAATGENIQELSPRLSPIYHEEAERLGIDTTPSRHRHRYRSVSHGRISPIRRRYSSYGVGSEEGELLHEAAHLGVREPGNPWHNVISEGVRLTHEPIRELSPKISPYYRAEIAGEHL